MSTERKVLVNGSKFVIASARDHSGSYPADEFINELSTKEKAQVFRLLKLLGDLEVGLPKNPEKFGSLDDGLYEIKSHQIRMPYAYSKSERQLVLVTHGFRKKRDKAPPEQIQRARRILEEDEEANKVLQIADHKKRRSRHEG